MATSGLRVSESFGSDVRQGGLSPRDPMVFASDVLGYFGQSGSAAHAYPAQLRDGSVTPLGPAVADVLHFFCILHGLHPSFAELAEAGAGPNCPVEVRNWLCNAALAFEHDRQWLARLAVIAGPPVNRLGLTTAEQVVRGQREAVLTLARSERAACALGAAAALAHDWNTIRRVLDEAGRRLWDEKSPPCGWAEDSLSADSTRQAIAATATSPATQRAVMFGATQLLGLHAALWDLLEARQAAALL